MSIQILDHGRLREIRLARPPVNALDTALCQALTAAVQQVGSDVDGVVLSGSERIFSGGMDVPHLLSHGTNRGALLESWTAFFDAANALAHCPVPVVAAIGGHAPAGGCVLALCCDYRVMARSADTARPYAIGLNEVQVGLTAPEGIQRLLRRVVGAHRAERLLDRRAAGAGRRGSQDRAGRRAGGWRAGHRARRGLAAGPAAVAAPTDAGHPRGGAC